MNWFIWFSCTIQSSNITDFGEFKLIWWSQDSNHNTGNYVFILFCEDDTPLSVSHVQMECRGVCAPYCDFWKMTKSANCIQISDYTCVSVCARLKSLNVVQIRPGLYWNHLLKRRESLSSLLRKTTFIFTVGSISPNPQKHSHTNFRIPDLCCIYIGHTALPTVTPLSYCTKRKYTLI